MKISKYNTAFSQSVTICLRESHRLGEINVSRHRTLGTEEGMEYQWEKATVNWCACGSQPIEKAEAFVLALNKAIELAKKMDKGEEITAKDMECPA